MGTEEGVEYLTLKDLKKYSIWKFSDIDDLDHPVTCAEDFPDNSYDLRIRTKFVTRTGIELLGYIVGVKDIYCIVVYVNDKKFYFNRNLPKDCQEDLDKLSKELGIKLSMSDFSPLKYKTDIDLEGFRNIEGEFDVLKEVTDEERLRGL